MTCYEDVERERRELKRNMERRDVGVALGIVLACCVLYLAAEIGIAAARGKFTHIPRNRTEAYR